MSGSTPKDVLELTTDPADAEALIGSATRVARDDFAGPGGWSTGVRDLLERAGLVEVGLEWDASACLTRIANGHTGTLRADVAAYPIGPFLGRTALYIGSPPCQTFSMAGKGAGREHLELLCWAVRAILLGHVTYEEAMVRLEAAGALDDKDGNPDPRNGLILIPARVIRQLLDHDGKGPTDLEAVALEQVVPARLVFEVYAAALRELGFSAVCVVINAADYGVPQTRERVFVLASRVRRVSVPEPTHAQGGEPESLFGPGRLPWVAMVAALGWAGDYLVGFPRRDDGGVEAALIGDEAYRARDLASSDGPCPTVTAKGRSLLRFRTEDVVLVNNVDLANQARRTLAEPAATITGGHDYSSRQFVPATPEAERFLLEDRLVAGHASQAAWATDRPATTVVGSFGPDVIAAPGYRGKGDPPRQKTPGSLRITEAEGGILQGFPADYVWEGKTKSKRWEQIGNVVCPPVARRVVAEVLGLGEVAPLPWHAYAFAGAEDLEETA